jgi:hypothetical protein
MQDRERRPWARSNTRNTGSGPVPLDGKEAVSCTVAMCLESSGGAPKSPYSTEGWLHEYWEGSISHPITSILIHSHLFLFLKIASISYPSRSHLFSDSVLVKDKN